MSLPRRRLIAATAGAVGLAALPRGAIAAPARLRVVSRVIEVNGRAANVFGIEGPGGRPGLTLDGPGMFEAELVNAIAEPMLVHWHGLTPPANQDGVPHLSQPPLEPGGTYAYRFANTRTGTHWMHSHMGLQEQLMLAAPLIVRDRADRQEREHVVLLHDFTFRDPEEILAELKGGGGAHAAHAGMDHGKMDMSQPMLMPAMLNDVVYDAYLANDRTLADPEVVSVPPGETIRLRIINGCAASNLWIDTGALEAELIATDGNPVVPVRGNAFPLAVAQRADLNLTMPKDGGAFAVLFRPEGTRMLAGIVLTSPGMRMEKLALTSENPAPALDLGFEAGLRALKPLKPGEGLRSEMLHLGGGGPDYVWTLNGKSGVHDTLFTVRAGERLEIAMMNMTSMAHPMHLHGHHFQVTGLSGRRIAGAMRDTVLVPANGNVTITFDADNPGTWAFHCHHVYHMNSGMMGAIAYVSPA
jgi:FtsP/CotA-like multicopper oxidase with cupredoxin domain